MWLQKWSPDFKPEEDLPIVPVWVNIPDLPFHLHTWHYVKQIAKEAGIPLEMDIATRGKTRPSMAKVRLEVDLLKPLLTSVWVGDGDDDSPLKGFEQKLEYENVPKYCKHCKKLGHSLINCRVLERRRINENRDTETKSNETPKLGALLEKERPAEEKKAVAADTEKQSRSAQNKVKVTNNEDKGGTIATTSENNKIIIPEENKRMDEVNTRTKKKKNKRNQEGAKEEEKSNFQNNQ
nr:uncharacterized protein LOC108948042 [Nicotiana tomentosiformis]